MGGRAVLVVGGSSGIGLAVAEQCVRRGDDVTLVARDQTRLDEVAADLATGPGRVTAHAADITDGSALADAVTAAVARFGRLDAVLTTAQAMAYGTVEEVPAEALRRVLDIAVVGTAQLAQVVLPVFRRQGHGRLVVVGSLLSQIAVPSMGAYCSAKAAQHALVRGLQQEVGRERGIDVRLVLPGAVDTPVYEQAASYAGSRGSAPPPIASAATVAARCVDALDGRTRPVIYSGAGNRLTVFGYRYLPWVYDRLAHRLVRLAVLRGPDLERPDEGNLFRPVPDGEGVSGGWTRLGRVRPPGGGRPRWRRR